VWLAELCERGRREGQSLLDRLHGIYRDHGAWGSAQSSLFKPGSAGVKAISDFLERLASAPPSELAGLQRESFLDYRGGGDSRAPWLGATALFELGFHGGARVLVRPSGTEPKLKIYADAVSLVGEGDTAFAASQRAKDSAQRLARELLAWFERG